MNADEGATKGRELLFKRIAVPVKHRDLIPFGKPTCKGCGGEGAYKVRRASKDGPGSWVPEVCGCAIKRYTKKQACVVSKDQLYAVPPYVHVSPETLAEHKEVLALVEPIQSKEGGGNGEAGEET